MTRKEAEKRKADAKRNYTNNYIKRHGCEPSADDLRSWNKNYVQRVAKREREAKVEDTFSSRLRFAMTCKNYTNKSLAELIFINPSVICGWRWGKNYPSVPMLITLSDVLDVSLDWLLKGEAND